MNKVDLEDITKGTFVNLNKISIVTPNMYEKLFYKQAKTLGFEMEKLKETEKLLETELNEIVNDENLFDIKGYFEKIQNTLTNVTINTANAVEAINNQDKSKLENIVQQMKQMEQEVNFLKEELYMDVLTKAKNRKWLYETFLHEEKFIKKGIMYFIDLDEFKLINDNFGHIIGDKVLLYTVSFFKQNFEYLNGNFNIVRYAGDEFILFFNNININEIEGLMKKVQLDFSNKKLKIKQRINTSKPQENIFNISFSCGKSLFKEGDKIVDILEVADEDMYNNKNKKLK